MKKEGVEAKSLLDVTREKALTNLGRRLSTPAETFLREHQISMVQALYEFLAHKGRAGYFNEPTGSGKSAVIVELAQVTGLKTVILSPTQPILDQTYQAAQRFTPDLNITNYDARSKDLSGQVINTTYQSIMGLLKNGKEFHPEEVELLLCDEAHMGLGEIRHTIYKDFPNALLIGLTATPEFTPLDGYIERGLVSEQEDWLGLFRNNIHEMTIEESMERGILVNLDVHMIRTQTQIAAIEVQQNLEYSPQDLEKFFNRKSRNALIIALLTGKPSAQAAIASTTFQEITPIHEKIKGKRTVVFCLSIVHANELAAQLQTMGISAKAVHNQTPHKERTDIFKAHASGEVQVVLGVDMLRIGWDSPLTEVSIHARPTMSGIVKVQEMGRVLRPAPNKEKAIAIELIDIVEKRTQIPISIANVFDPEFVLRGTQTGLEKRVSAERVEKLPPPIRFFGVNIQGLVEETRTQELLKTRFKNASITDINYLLDQIVLQEQKDEPEDSTYEWAKRIAQTLPQKVPAEAQATALQATASIDANTRKLGIRAIIFLNLKTVLSVVDSYAEQDKDELIQTAVLRIGEKLAGKINPHIQLSQQINNYVRDAVASTLGARDNIPLGIARSPKYLQVIKLLESSPETSEGEIKSLMEDIAKETGRDIESIEKAFQRRASQVEYREPQKTAEEALEEAVETTIKTALQEEIAGIVAELPTTREQEVIARRFGLKDGQAETLLKIGESFGVTSERIRQTEQKALRRLRHPRLSKRVKDYYLEPSSQSAWSELAPMPPDSLSLETLGVHFVTVRQLKNAGIKKIGDFFSSLPEEIIEEWQDSPDSLYYVIMKLNEHLINYQDDERVALHISQAIKYRNQKTTPSNYKKDLSRFKILLAPRLSIIPTDFTAGETYELILSFGINPRTAAALERENITFDQFMSLTPDELLDIRNIGIGGLREIQTIRQKIREKKQQK